MFGLFDSSGMKTEADGNNSNMVRKGNVYFKKVNDNMYIRSSLQYNNRQEQRTIFTQSTMLVFFLPFSSFILLLSFVYVFTMLIFS